MPSLTSTSVLNPSDLVDFMDTKRTMELLFDDGDLDDDEDIPSVDDIDDNSRAVKLANAAWYEVTMAARRGNIYTERELVDLANDTARGMPLVELVAMLFWCKLIKRRRYVQGEPQAEEAVCEEANNKLELLRRGERIFVLDGVTTTNSAGTATGTYSDDVSDAGAIAVGTFGASDINPAQRFWGCTNVQDTINGGSSSDPYDS